jgi:DNA repair protein RadC
VTEMARRGMNAQLRSTPVFNSPLVVREYLQLQIGHLPHEVFCVLFLDAQHRLLACEELFRGTLTQTSVYPREVVKQCLQHNAASVILAHNHPSGLLEPSRADELLTQTLKSSLSLIDVRILDHFVVGGTGAVSFAERGLL